MLSAEHSGNTDLALSHSLRQPGLFALAGGNRSEALLGHNVSGWVFRILHYVVRGLVGV